LRRRWHRAELQREAVSVAGALGCLAGLARASRRSLSSLVRSSVFPFTLRPASPHELHKATRGDRPPLALHGLGQMLSDTCGGVQKRVEREGQRQRRRQTETQRRRDTDTQRHRATERHRETSFESFKSSRPGLGLGHQGSDPAKKIKRLQLLKVLEEP